MYIALPNSMHAEYTIRAANAGVHVLCEKPMAVTVDECQRMIDACREAGVKLMIAYRLHFEPINLSAIELVARGRLGDPKFFNSSFSMRVKPGNIRTQRELGGGTLYDIGIYCINAARYLFRAEPKEVMAVSVNSGATQASRNRRIDRPASLRFDGERVASFVTSFNAADTGFYQVVGTKGSLRVDPAYEYQKPLGYELTIDGKKTKKRGRKHDQFAPELMHFSDCILKNRSRSRQAKRDCRTCGSSRRSTSPPRPARPCSCRPTGSRSVPVAGSRWFGHQSRTARWSASRARTIRTAERQATGRTRATDRTG